MQSYNFYTKKSVKFTTILHFNLQFLTGPLTFALAKIGLKDRANASPYYIIGIARDAELAATLPTVAPPTRRNKGQPFWVVPCNKRVMFSRF